MELIIRQDPQVYDDEIALFGEKPPNNFINGGDSFLPSKYEWRSGVRRVSKTQYEDWINDEKKLIEAENCVGSTRQVEGSARLWFATKNGLYFICAGTEEDAVRNFQRHFETRFE